jgi:beta-xylosidase
VAGGAGGGTGGLGGSAGAAGGGASGGATAGSGGSQDAGVDANYPPAPTTFDNPIIKYDAPDPTIGPGNNIFTADGAAMVWNDKVYLYVDEDAAPVNAKGYVITNWLLYESSDMVRWESKGSIATCKSISWCKDNGDGGLAAFQVIERDDKAGNPKFYLYGAVNNGQGISIVVMVADKPEGPFKDARGIPLVYPADTANMGATHSWRNLDPTALVDDDGQAYLGWGNQIFFTAKLEDDMIHLKGETYTLDAGGNMQNRSISNVKIIAHPKASQGDWSDYEEAPWLSKHGGLYYLTYAAKFPETINYATATSPEGPWKFQGVVIAREPNDASTLHQTLFDFRGASYMGYHSAELPTGSDYRRGQCVDRVYYNADGTLKKLVRTHKQ